MTEATGTSAVDSLKPGTLEKNFASEAFQAAHSANGCNSFSLKLKRPCQKPQVFVGAGEGIRTPASQRPTGWLVFLAKGPLQCLQGSRGQRDNHSATPA